jgi:hypothetical protein
MNHERTLLLLLVAVTVGVIVSVAATLGTVYDVERRERRAAIETSRSLGGDPISAMPRGRLWP